MGDLEAEHLIDFSQPVAVLMTGLLHLIPDEGDPAGLVARYMSAMVPGSYVVLSHMTVDQKPPLAAEAVRSVGRQTGGWFPRSKDEFRRILGDMEIVPPYEGTGPDVTWVGTVAVLRPGAGRLRRFPLALRRGGQEARLTVEAWS